MIRTHYKGTVVPKRREQLIIPGGMEGFQVTMTFQLGQEG